VAEKIINSLSMSLELKLAQWRDEGRKSFDKLDGSAREQLLKKKNRRRS